MAEVTAIDPRPLAPGVSRAAGVAAGPWVFLTGHGAADLASGVAAEVTGTPGLPFHGQPRHRREGDAIYRRFRELLEANGSSLAHAVRLDQYYSTWRAVDPYHRARKAAFKTIPPSTSVLMEELLVPDCAIDVSLVAVRADAGLSPRPVVPGDVPVPEFSGFVPALVAGDYVFVAGQMANAESMDGLDRRASKPKTALWNGTDIRLQTEFLITSRLRPALEAGGSSLRNAIKAQVYLTDIADTPEFLDVWTSHFRDAPCALTIVPTSGFGFVDGIIEINIFGVREGGAIRKEVIDVDLPAGMSFGPAAVRAGDLLCLSGLLAANGEGPLVDADTNAALRHLGVGARRQTEAILAAAERICGAGGTRLQNVVRANHFLTSLYDFLPTQIAWSEALAGAPVPAGAVRVPEPMPVPGCTVMIDMWAYVPGR